ncbi:hypothetical protein Y032_0177g578 [Ancylostoma ceylanicum]|uniref:Uncharacterized protein n=1 Tax=Ancylostoma ceylanicum TaxID=53326 RepID=A0A016SU51_9BILA|nr:hypothetical protein Y032_0177g578 [Ancylostoma ceylanicum]
MLTKIHHYVSANPELAYYARGSALPDTYRLPYFNMMPIDILARTRRYHVVRLSTMLGILDGRPLTDIPLHRLITYTYEMLAVADAAINGSSGRVLTKHRAGLIRTDLNSETAIRLKEQDNSKTLAEVLLRDYQTEIRCPWLPSSNTT